MRRRMTLVILFFLALLIALEARLFLMAIVHHRDYTALASRQHGIAEELSAARGSIFAADRAGRAIPLSVSRNYKVLVASPDAVEDAGPAAEAVAAYFGADKNDVEKKLSKEHDAHEVLLRKIDPDRAAGFDLKRFPGLSFEDESRRVYPNGILAAHLLGFVSVERDREKGRYGLEQRYDADLAGTVGAFSGVRDATSFLVALGRRIVRPPQGGAALSLTIDYAIQQKAEETLAAAHKKWSAASGDIIVLDPATGKILALAARPAFDPNAFSKEKDFGVFLNPAAETTYEPGSVMKPIVMAGAVEEMLVTPDTTYTDTGEVRFGNHVVRNYDAKAHGVQTMTGVLEHSLNTGAVHVARLLGQERQRGYMEKFGFGTATGVDLPGEVLGNISNLNPDTGREIDFAAASFGQGISVTPLQMASAIAALANGGILMRPYVVERVVDDSGNERIMHPISERRVVSTSTAETLTKMLVSAVRSGFENRAGVRGYFVAGKTGTAQIPKPGGGGYSDAVAHTFIGYAPAFKPRFLVMLRLNEPKGNLFASNTLTPAFHDLAEFILNYYEVPPDEK